MSELFFRSDSYNFPDVLPYFEDSWDAIMDAAMNPNRRFFGKAVRNPRHLIPVNIYFIKILCYV